MHPRREHSKRVLVIRPPRDRLHPDTLSVPVGGECYLWTRRSIGANQFRLPLHCKADLIRQTTRLDVLDAAYLRPCSKVDRKLACAVMRLTLLVLLNPLLLRREARVDFGQPAGAL